MERVLRFNEYDVFAYVLTGFAAMLVGDVALDTHWVLRTQWGVPGTVVVIFAAYVVGHVVAWPAAWLLERRLVRGLLGAPSKALFCEAPGGVLTGVKRFLFPDYFTPLDRAMRERVAAKVHMEGHPASSGESLFWVAFSRARRDPLTYGRMESFLKLYGFCRNIAFVGLAAAALLIGHAIWLLSHTAPAVEIVDRLWWAVVALIAGIIMLYRYLKFHRLYSVEVFAGYLELPLLEGKTYNAS